MTTATEGIALERMRAALADWVALSEAQFATLASIFEERQAAKGDRLLQPGDRRHEILFVVDGLLRFYYGGEDGAESNKAFVAEDTFAGALASARLDLPVLYGIEALEPTTYLAADCAAFTALYEADPVFDRLGRCFAELLLVRKERRTRSFLQHDARARYDAFRAAHPDLLQRVPQYHIASYLGVSEVHLSRLRRGAGKTENVGNGERS
ncbi:MAG: Crp/Fnr family transcriptional regulator [Bacteroidota bacterium]